MAGINDIIMQTYAGRPLVSGVDRGLQSLGGMALDERRARAMQAKALEDERRAYELKLRALEGQIGVPLAGEEVRTSLPESFDALAVVYNDALAGRQAALDEATGIEAVLAQMPDAPGAEASREALLPYLVDARAREGDRLQEARGLEGVLRTMSTLPGSYMTGAKKPTAYQSAEGIGRGQAMLDARAAQQAQAEAEAKAQRDMEVERFKAEAKARTGGEDPYKGFKFQEDLEDTFWKRVADPVAAVSEFRSFDSLFRGPDGRLDFSNVGAAGQIASVFKFMKTMDPRSVVRESEFDQAAGAGGWGTKVKNYIQAIEDGKFLSPAQLQDFYSTVQKIAKSADARAREEADRARRKARQFQQRGAYIDPDAMTLYEGVTFDDLSRRGSERALPAPVKGRIE